MAAAFDPRLDRFGHDFKRLFTLSEYYDRDPHAFDQAIPESA